MSLTRWRSPPTSPGLELLDFRYGPLKSFKTSIRLAKIKPGSGNKGISIELIESFVTVPGQRSQIEYDALSYTWGESRRTKSIICNGRRLAVTPTLIEALHHFRHADHEVILWIDQLCICQERVLERNSQVNLMGDIFAGARKVSVWLGAHSGDSKAGLQLAKQLLSIHRHTNVTRLDPVQLEAHGLPRRGHRKWKALAAILRRPWFWRTWIVQEVVLNDNVELVLGDNILRWEDLEAIVDLVEGPNPHQSQNDPTMSAWELPFSRINRIRLRHQQRKLALPVAMNGDINGDQKRDIIEESISLQPPCDSDHELDLLDLLLMSRDLQATDPLDKIYALLGLGRHEMIPDYTSTTETVFCDFALQVVGAVTRLVSPGAENKLSSDDENVRKALILLSCAGIQNQNLKELPSWVPDWTANLASRPFIFNPNFNAGGSVMEKLDWHYETGLQLCGKLVDTVSAAGITQLSYDESSDAAAQISCWWKEINQLAHERVVRSPGSSTHMDAFQSLCHQLCLDENGFYRGDGRIKRRTSLLVELDPAQDAEHRAQQTLIFGSIRGRVLFVTSTGWIGLAPHGTQEGDLVYVILGSSVPYVLRPRKDEAQAFELVGEAYVQGIMNGEALEMDWIGIEDVYVR